MTKIIQINFKSINNKWVMGVIRDDDYIEREENNLEDIKESLEKIIEKANTIMSEEQKILVDTLKAYEDVLKVVVEVTPENDLENYKHLFNEWDSNSKEYKKDDVVVYNDYLYKVLQEHTSQLDWQPNLAKSLFVQINKPNDVFEYGKNADGGNRELSVNPYKVGEKVLFEGKVYMWIQDNIGGVWSPRDYPQGWQLEE